jgi:hypothetical protein
MALALAVEDALSGLIVERGPLTRASNLLIGI